MIDHAPRIRAEQQAEQENAIMADLEQRSAPLYWALVAAARKPMPAAVKQALIKGGFNDANQ